MEVRWKLRMAAAQREIWTGADLRRLLAERAGVADVGGVGVGADAPRAQAAQALDP